MTMFLFREKKIKVDYTLKIKRWRNLYSLLKKMKPENQKY